jgi:hypothetical protein
MKEEVGMKRKGPSMVVVGMAAAGLVAWLASSVSASVDQGPENIYTNLNGVNGAVGTVSPARPAGPELNPGGEGQLLFFGLYDVRPIENPTSGALDPQITNLAILNTAPIPGNQNQGVMARIRFRESKTSIEVLDFNIVLSCGQVWVAEIFLGGNNLPVVRGPDPVVTGNVFAPSIVYSPVIASGREFARPGALPDVDMQRGYFEVFAEQSLPCAPATGDERTGTYDQSGLSATELTPPNTLAGTAYLVRPGAGISYQYNATAIARFVSEGQGNITSAVTTSSPDLLDCIFADGSSDVNCVDAVDLQLAKSRVMYQWDESLSTDGQTFTVYTFPSKHQHCAVSGAIPDYTGGAGVAGRPPFQCTPVSVGGEEVGCTIYNRVEQFVQGDDIFSPSQEVDCLLPREVTFQAMVATSTECEPTSSDFDSRCDEGLVYTELPGPNFPGANETGWVDVDTFFSVHFKDNLDPTYAQVLGTGFTEYLGLPVIALTIQEYTNGNVGGVFGSAVPALYEVAYGASS